MEYHFGLIGYPLGHSLSPVIHQAALQELGLQGEYRLYPLKFSSTAVDPLLAMLAKLRRGELHGLNVTIPYKRLVQPYIDHITPAATTIGSINTICVEKGKLVGDNTDAPGFLVDLHAQFGLELSSRKRKTALLLGAGGAAHAVVYALLQQNWQVIVAARRVEQAQALVQNLFPRAKCLTGAGNLNVVNSQLCAVLLDGTTLRSIPHFDLLVNATSAGMSPHTDENSWPEELTLPKDCVVYDLVYNPLQTRLVQFARQQGVPAESGLGMLIEQAALSFERWTTLKPSRSIMKAAALSNLQASSVERP